MTKANRADAHRTNPRFDEAFRKSRLTETELAKRSGLHINTVKKILRADHVHPNSETKLERALEMAIAEKAGHAKVTRIHQAAIDGSATARKRSVLANAEALAQEVNSMVIELAKAEESMTNSELAQLRTFALMISNSLSLLETAQKK